MNNLKLYIITYNMAWNLIPQKFLYIDYLDPLHKKNTPGGQTGVPAVPKVVLFNITNTFNRF